MNVRLLFYLSTFLLYNNLIYGQYESCTNPNDIITNTGGNTFTTAIADQYYWEICDGNATTSINGSNTSPTVTVNNPTNETYSIKVVRFENGNCMEACKMVEEIDPCSGCTSSIEISLSPLNPLAHCYTANVSINTITPCLYSGVNWEWSTNSNSGEILGGAVNEVIPHTHPSNIPPPSISICASLIGLNGIVCSNICKSFSLRHCIIPNDSPCQPGHPDWPDCP